MHTEGRESELLIALAQTRGELAREKARADAAEAHVRTLTEACNTHSSHAMEALAAARRECEGLRAALLDVKADLGYAEWGTPEHGANLLQHIIAKHHPRLSAALAAPGDGEEGTR